MEVEYEFEWLDDELKSGCDSDYEVGSPRKNETKRYTEFNPQTDLPAAEFKLGMVFPTVEDFRKAVREYAIREQRNIWFPTNERHRVRAKCNGVGGCPWILFASTMRGSQSVVVKTINNEHTCNKFFEITFINLVWLAYKYESKWESELDWK